VGSETEVFPRERRRASPPRKTSETQAAKERLHPDFHCGEGERPLFEIELEIAYARQGLTATVDDLGVENVPRKQELASRERGGFQADPGSQGDSGPFEGGNGMPGHVADSPS
jgi:hypothetical protein